MEGFKAKQPRSIRQTLCGCFASSSFVCKLTVVRSRFNATAQIRHDADWWWLLFCVCSQTGGKRGHKNVTKTSQALKATVFVYVLLCVFCLFLFHHRFQSQQATELDSACSLCHTRTIRKHSSFKRQLQNETGVQELSAI